MRFSAPSAVAVVAPAPATAEAVAFAEPRAGHTARNRTPGTMTAATSASMSKTVPSTVVMPNVPRLSQIVCSALNSACGSANWAARGAWSTSASRLITSDRSHATVAWGGSETNENMRPLGTASTVTGACTAARSPRFPPFISLLLSCCHTADFKCVRLLYSVYNSIRHCPSHLENVRSSVASLRASCCLSVM